MTTQHPRIPSSTYRLQFNRQFTFTHAREIVPYLDALGISDCYASPYFQARAESLHGYDITDHNKLNAAIGSRADYDAWIADLHAHGMGQIVDFVPNHMGVGEPLNQWWMDVLENGPSSIYAPYFDIQWKPLKSDLEDKVLLPILGDQYGRVLERGELQVHFDAGAFFLRYYDHEFPLAPGTYRHILEIALEKLKAFQEEDFYAEFQSIITALEYLPRRTETDPERIAERAREKEIIKRRLERRCQEAPQVQAAVMQAVADINGKAGESRSFDALDQLLNDQSYRLAFWRVAAEEINYRRFFDVNDLAAIRMELPEVFDATHKLLLELIGAGAVSGVRIDHPDGLYLPKEYFEKLQRRCAAVLGLPFPEDGRASYLLVEKILSGNETLRKDWPVHGTTGYEFAKLLSNVLVDASAEQAITKTFQRFIGHSMHFGHLVYAKKRLVMRLSLANDVNVLGDMLDRLSETNRWFRDFTLDALARAVHETIACFPVYRTYVAPGQPVSDEDRAIIERAVIAAKRRNPALEESVFNFLRDILLFRFPENVDDEARAAHAHFVLKFQQSTGPIMAKGLEDTAFYIYNRLAALNEVGGEPQHFGISVNEFHERNLERQHDWPATLLATSTHDTKRSEDVRARMLAIAEVPQLWRSALQRWRVINRRWKRNLDDATAPDANEEYLFYQTLLGTWPIDATGRAEPAVDSEYIERIQAYMAKALKEAKVNTSWIQPNEAWDSAMSDFVAKVLDSSPKNKFLPSFLPVAEEIARLGAINSLSQVALKLTAPGVPDIYQGSEIWNFSLVDPDNRRPVDYQQRKELLESLEKAPPEELLEQWPDGRIKLFLTQRLLRFRRDHQALFKHGKYLPLSLSGAFADCCVAFAREHEGQWIAVLAPRLSSRVGFPPIGEKWQDTAAELPASLSREGAKELFTGRELHAENDKVKLSEAMTNLPFAVYTNQGAAI
ncbi:MAG TPA: malto-oligosyltrehalose synthase [Chthoniobacterales bacterium]|nr:malto-oligosyltrehalose synthase [Chthoniobacterales bacterium]